MDNKWILVENKNKNTFPKNHKNVLTINPIDGQPPEYYIVDFCFEELDGLLHWDYGEDNVVCWQPLPLPPPEEPVSNESISEDELICRLDNCNCVMDCVEVAKQYSNTKLEELEKWVNEEIEKLHKLAVLALTDHNNPFTGRANDLKKLKEKIKLLK